MTKQEFNEHIDRILANIEGLPAAQRKAILEMAEDTRRRDQDIRDTMARAREALDDWRIVQKYRIFDAEATAREAAARRSVDENECE